MDLLTQRAQRLIDEFEEGEDIRHGIANVLKHLAYAFDMVCDGEGESLIGVPVSILDELAVELEAPGLKESALAHLNSLVALIPTEGAMAMAEPIRIALEALPNEPATEPTAASLKKQACDALDTYVYGNPNQGDKVRTYNTIRAALETLPK